MVRTHCSSGSKEKLLEQVGCSARGGRGQCGSVSPLVKLWKEKTV
jgi:hypothetical protein